MLARDWYYNERRQIGLDSAVASIYELHDDRDARARATLDMLDVQPGWRVADIGCGNGVLACEAAMLGAEVDAIDISPAMLALAEIQAGDRKVAIRTQSAGLLSFAYQPNSYDLVVSEFTLHHLPDFWKAVAMSRIYNALKPGACFFLRDIVFVSMPDGSERDVEAWADFNIKNHGFARDSVVTHMRDEYSTFGWVIERMLTDVGFTLVSADYHAPLHGTYLLRKPKPGEQSLEATCMKPADVCLAVTVAVIWGLGFIASRIALDEFSPPLMTTLRFVFAALPCLFVPRPKVSWPVLIAISFTLFLGQFLAQAYGIGHGVPVGLSSVIVQSQALFTIGFAAILFREVPTPMQGDRHRHRRDRPADDLRHRRL